MKKTVIQRNKKNLLFILLVSVLFVVLGFYILELPFKSFPGVEYIVGGACIVTFGTVFVFAFLFLLDNKPAIIVDEYGVTDNTSNTGYIKWEDISEIEIKKTGGKRFMIIHLKNPEYYIERGPKNKKWLLRRNHKAHGSPVNIPEISIKHDFDELYNLLILRLQIKNGDKLA